MGSPRGLSQGHKNPLLPFWIQPNLTRSPTIIIGYVHPLWNSYLKEALHAIIQKNAVELVKTWISLGFFDRLFLVPKPNNSWRSMLDLSTLNQFPKIEKLKMETLATITTSFQAGEWVTSIDFKDTSTYLYKISPGSTSNSRHYLLACPQYLGNL